MYVIKVIYIYRERQGEKEGGKKHVHMQGK